MTYIIRMKRTNQLTDHSATNCSGYHAGNPAALALICSKAQTSPPASDDEEDLPPASFGVWRFSVSGSSDATLYNHTHTLFSSRKAVNYPTAACLLLWAALC